MISYLLINASYIGLISETLDSEMS